MKKEQKNKQTLKRFRFKIFRDVVIVTLIQLVIIGIGVAAAYGGNIPVSEKNTETISFRPDKVESRSNGFLNITSKYVVFYHNSEEYKYGHILINQYDGDDLVKDLENEYLMVTCLKGTNRVVALTGENILFYTLRDYNISATIGFVVIAVILMPVIESVFLFLVWTHINLCYVSSDKIRTIKKLKSKLKRTEEIKLS